MKFSRFYIFIVSLFLVNSLVAMDGGKPTTKSLIDIVNEIFPGQKFPPSFEVALDAINDSTTDFSKIPNQFLIHSTAGNGKKTLIRLILDHASRTYQSTSETFLNSDTKTSLDNLPFVEIDNVLTFLVIHDIEKLTYADGYLLNFLKNMSEFRRTNRFIFFTTNHLAQVSSDLKEYFKYQTLEIKSPEPEEREQLAKKLLAQLPALAKLPEKDLQTLAKQIEKKAGIVSRRDITKIVSIADAFARKNAKDKQNYQITFADFEKVIDRK